MTELHRSSETWITVWWGLFCGEEIWFTGCPLTCGDIVHYDPIWTGAQTSASTYSSKGGEWVHQLWKFPQAVHRHFHQVGPPTQDLKLYRDSDFSSKCQLNTKRTWLQYSTNSCDNLWKHFELLYYSHPMKILTLLLVCVLWTCGCLSSYLRSYYPKAIF
jgi:hypothetical protein